MLPRLPTQPTPVTPLAPKVCRRLFKDGHLHYTMLENLAYHWYGCGRLRPDTTLFYSHFYIIHSTMMNNLMMKNLAYRLYWFLQFSFFQVASLEAELLRQKSNSSSNARERSWPNFYHIHHIPPHSLFLLFIILFWSLVSFQTATVIMIDFLLTISASVTSSTKPL